MSGELDQLKDFLGQLKRNWELLNEEYNLALSLGYPKLSEIEQTLIPIKKYLDKYLDSKFYKEAIDFDVFKETKRVRKKLLKCKRIKNTLATVTTELASIQERKKTQERVRLLKSVLDTATINQTPTKIGIKNYDTLLPDFTLYKDLQKMRIDVNYKDSNINEFDSNMDQQNEQNHSKHSDENDQVHDEIVGEINQDCGQFQCSIDAADKIRQAKLNRM